jgi:hypothetical protein
MTQREFTCAKCGGTFNCGWTEEEALAEAQQNWGDVPVVAMDQICDDCHAEFLKWFKATYGCTPEEFTTSPVPPSRQ